MRADNQQYRNHLSFPSGGLGRHRHRRSLHPPLAPPAARSADMPDSNFETKYHNIFIYEKSPSPTDFEKDCVIYQFRVECKIII